MFDQDDSTVIASGDPGPAKSGNRDDLRISLKNFSDPRGVTADTALRLARYFGTTPQMWLNLQQTCDLRRAEIAVGRRVAESGQSRDTAA